MWFKNLSIFRLTESFVMSPDELERKLQAMPFRPAGLHEETSFGWTAPLGKNSEQLVHSSNGFMMLCGKKEEKVLPSAVINELVQEKYSDAEAQQGRKLSKKERANIKDELIFELLPKAFSFSRKTFAYIDPKGSWLIVDAGSAKTAEDLLSHLRKCLGSLPAMPINTASKPSTVLTGWLQSNQPPDDIVIEDECELRSPGEEGGIIRCKRHNLSAPEITNHLDTGKLVIKLAVSWADRFSFIIDEHLSIKRLRFLDVIQNQVADMEIEDEAQRFDADFSIMSLEMSEFLPRLLEIFGGENLS
ncbi:MAG: recombination-associated protein RdgC [Gammaproteobacteria bacterium]